MNVDGNPSYPKVITELKQERHLGRRCRCRTCPYLNNNLEQDHRAIKRRVNASQGLRSFEGAWRTLQGYEILHMIREGQVRWLTKGDVVGQAQFINGMFGVAGGLNNYPENEALVEFILNEFCNTSGYCLLESRVMLRSPGLNYSHARGPHRRPSQRDGGSSF